MWPRTRPWTAAWADYGDHHSFGVFHSFTLLRCFTLSLFLAVSFFYSFGLFHSFTLSGVSLFYSFGRFTLTLFRVFHSFRGFTLSLFRGFHGSQFFTKWSEYEPVSILQQSKKKFTFPSQISPVHFLKLFHVFFSLMIFRCFTITIITDIIIFSVDACQQEEEGGGKNKWRRQGFPDISFLTTHLEVFCQTCLTFSHSSSMTLAHCHLSQRFSYMFLQFILKYDLCKHCHIPKIFIHFLTIHFKSMTLAKVEGAPLYK